MRATVLLSTSALLLAAACGKGPTVALTAKLVMSRVPSDWCGSGNPDNIRLDCPFELGLYVVQMNADAGFGKVLKTVCVGMDADPMRKWGNLSDSLNSAMAKLEPIEEGLVRIEIAGFEPAPHNRCAYEDAMGTPSFYGKSEVIPLMGTEVPNRFDIGTKCLRPFTPTAMCIP